MRNREDLLQLERLNFYRSGCLRELRKGIKIIKIYVAGRDTRSLVATYINDHP